MNEDMRNMFLAIAISLALVFGVQTFLPQLFPSMQTQPEQQQTVDGGAGSRRLDRYGVRWTGGCCCHHA